MLNHKLKLLSQEDKWPGHVKPEYSPETMSTFLLIGNLGVEEERAKADEPLHGQWEKGYYVFHQSGIAPVGGDEYPAELCMFKDGGSTALCDGTVGLSMIRVVVLEKVTPSSKLVGDVLKYTPYEGKSLYESLSALWIDF
jgi:hypothetical protein